MNKPPMDYRGMLHLMVNASRGPPRPVCFWLALRYCALVGLEVLCLFECELVPKINMVRTCSRDSTLLGLERV